MSGDKSSKTEEPTPKKLQDARKKAQVARSEEFVPLMMIILGVFYFWYSWDWFSSTLQAYISSVGVYAYDRDFNSALDLSLSLWLDVVILKIMLPFTGLMLVAGIMGNLVQFGFLFSLDPIKPKPEKVNPIAGFKRIFSMKQVIKTLLSILKIVTMSIIVIFIVRTAISEYMHDIGQCDLNCQFAVFTYMLKKMMFILIPILILMVMMDFIFQKMQFRKDQRMSKDEIKREYKNMEGDPEIKGERKSEQRRLLEQDVKDQIRQSRVVIAGMRKTAALMYEEGMALPILLAIGRDRMSLQMVQIAKKEGIPVVADPALVNMLEEDGILDQYIPSSAIKRVARAMGANG
ncbi:MAG: EscU/YscU/HrcU family type III secretion system export apparatus switch protein [Thiotrichaceae bacterium]|nr:EscU/YscU/HrcU family type III secretion system export apparatus switch protein [Thiotrichaceae bacterium]